MDMATVLVVLIMSMVIVVLVLYLQTEIRLRVRLQGVIRQLEERVMALTNEAYLKKRVGNMDTQLEVTTGKEHMLQTLYKMDGSLDRRYD